MKCLLFSSVKVVMNGIAIIVAVVVFAWTGSFDLIGLYLVVRFNTSVLFFKLHLITSSLALVVIFRPLVFLTIDGLSWLWLCWLDCWFGLRSFTLRKEELTNLELTVIDGVEDMLPFVDADLGGGSIFWGSLFLMFSLLDLDFDFE